MTLEEKIIASGYTLVMFCNFGELHTEIERRLNRPVMVHEIPSLEKEIKEAFREDFIKMCKTE